MEVRPGYLCFGVIPITAVCDAFYTKYFYEQRKDVLIC